MCYYLFTTDRCNILISFLMTDHSYNFQVRKNKFIEILPINVGCLGACTYCKTKHARGHLGSYTIESLVDRVKIVVSEGVREIWLSSEDTGAYGNTIVQIFLDSF
jgi:tRNA A37 methylthiotransferase MiaB